MSEAPPASAPPRSKKLAIVSTYDRLCGIASYTKSLTGQLAESFDVELLALDTDLLRERSPDKVREGDAHVRALAARLRQFDIANVHIEHSMFGIGRENIFRRLKWILEEAPALCLTVHWLVPAASISLDGILKACLKLDIGGIDRMISEAADYKKLGPEFYQLVKRLQNEKPVSIVVHKRADRSLLEREFQLRNIFDHPLAFVPPEQAREIRQTASRKSFPILQKLPDAAKIVGTFGFLTPYKGFETAIRALKHTPPDYHLAIFGGLHPYALKRDETVNAYVRTLMNEIESSGDLADRVHFCGSLTDEAFLEAMAVCDMVVMPYLDIGLSSSGPMSQAIEMGARIIASRTSTFLDLASYHPDRIEFFDISNYLELAGRIAAPAEFPLTPLSLNTITNCQTYEAASKSHA